MKSELTGLGYVNGTCTDLRRGVYPLPGRTPGTMHALWSQLQKMEEGEKAEESDFMALILVVSTLLEETLRERREAGGGGDTACCRRGRSMGPVSPGERI